ncbi:hypothetical protein FHS67_001384 [Aminobacter aminovorans]|jgi:hypothetical protein|uniref:Uncharacterized protein n=1 Tax=Aminobacter aminovorans TaxID=83263 RepID=A0ABR6H3J8_AMIAI|nr:hypothetical protein [Aminobacter aminovorans]
MSSAATFGDHNVDSPIMRMELSTIRLNLDQVRRAFRSGRYPKAGFG